MTRKLENWKTLVWIAALAGCSGPIDLPLPVQPSTARVAINDLGTGTYLGFQGGLYPNGSNVVPAGHAAEGIARTKLIRPLDVNGNPSANGKYVLISIGMSNTTQEFCSAGSNPPCDSWSFMGQAAADASVNHTTLALVNGAMGGQVASDWDAASDPDYDLVRQKLTAAGVSEKQVQIIWLKVAQSNPLDSLPNANSDAYQMVQEQGAIVRALKARYPNLQQIFMSSRIYAGYATSTLNPEPFAYQTGFAVKWTIEAQINEMTNGAVNTRAGTLNYNTSPWLAWGPYLWANGMTPRSDGLTWAIDDFVSSDRTHPSESGRTKVANMLLQFFKTSQFTKCWFVAGQAC